MSTMTVCSKCFCKPCTCGAGGTGGGTNTGSGGGGRFTGGGGINLPFTGLPFTGDPVNYDGIREIVREELLRHGYVPGISDEHYKELVEKAEKYERIIKILDVEDFA